MAIDEKVAWQSVDVDLQRVYSHVQLVRRDLQARNLRFNPAGNRNVQDQLPVVRHARHDAAQRQTMRVMPDAFFLR